ncbi:MAG: serine/threonine protein kinase [Lamprocystis purpurea]|nr:serine/threonine protein kinase [Lamprocystis purpurea]
MGIVYEAHDPAIDRKVAIKLIRADLLDGEERQNYIERFQREAQAAGRCNHPGIVAIFDFALHEGNPFLAMEYVEGLGLDRVLAHGERFTPAAAVQFILQVLDALACAHALGIVHRDIKPSNVLIMSGGRIKVMDFGIARIDNSDLTHAGTAIGTPSYMSPEQCRGGAVDLRTDLFSVATADRSATLSRQELHRGCLQSAERTAERRFRVGGRGRSPPERRAAPGAGQAAGRPLSQCGRDGRRDPPGGRRGCGPVSAAGRDRQDGDGGAGS